jgi:glutamate-1-semialdehyde 2,1-aminomutase
MTKRKDQSWETFKQLSQIIPGGVNSPFRSFHEVEEKTLLAARGKGAYLWDRNGKRYLDYLCAWGPAILGHAHPVIVKAAKKAIEDSPVLGLSTEWELKMAKLVQKAFPSMEMMRFVNSGAEAVESVIRLARGYTRRPKIVRFEGGYHGHYDSILWTYGPEEKHSPEECGVPKDFSEDTLIVQLFRDFLLL